MRKKVVIAEIIPTNIRQKGIQSPVVGIRNSLSDFVRGVSKFRRRATPRIPSGSLLNGVVNGLTGSTRKVNPLKGGKSKKRRTMKNKSR